VLGLLASPALLSNRSGRRAALVAGVSYAALVVAATVQAKPHQHRADPVVVAVAFPVMHAAWGAGFLASAVQDLVTGGPGEAR
jgi:hypothetical protein